MAPKNSEIGVVDRARIVPLRENGNSYREIAKQVKLSFSTVRHIIKKYDTTRNIENLKRSGRPRILTTRERHAVVRSAQKNPFTSAAVLAEEVRTCTGKVVHPQNIRRVLHSAQLHGRSPRKKPFISEQNRRKRLQFAKEHRTKPLEFSSSVIWSDEIKYNLFGSDGKQSVWRKPNTELETCNIHPTIKHG